MASYLTNAFKGRLLGDNAQISTAIDLEADTLKLMLLTSSHIPDIDAEVFAGNISANEISSSGTYTAGFGNRMALTVTSSTDDIDDEGVMDAVDVSITSATITARYAPIIKEGASDAASPIGPVIDFGSDQISTAGTFTITFAAEGILNLA